MTSRTWNTFQSLLHQGISLLCNEQIPTTAPRSAPFQSLLHQGISLLDTHDGPSRRRGARVSIPSSSGHQFTGRRTQQARRKWRGRFNPFFIRASVYWATSPKRAASSRPSFQSLLHQGISLLVACFGNVHLRQSLRFNPFFIRASVYWTGLPLRKSPGSPRFQSLLHQGISLLGAVLPAGWRIDTARFNPFFIRASVYWPLTDFTGVNP